MTTRQVAKIVTGQPTSDGAGVRLTRVIGTGALPELDPFLLLDEFGSEEANDYLAGFPDHPHRGFETVTYMLAGNMRHQDNKGNTGHLGPGSVQWMTAGRGIVHSEMPEQENGLMRGFQLWVNLPGKDKMTDPRYQDIPASAVPQLTTADGVKVRILAGSHGGVTGPVSGVATEPIYFDIALAEGQTFETQVPSDHTAFVYVFEGSVLVDAKPLLRGQLGVLGPGDVVRLQGKDVASRALLIAGRALHEPIARYGPFVMNTEAEIRQAFVDFRGGRL
jgi:quercetin 2,3-dioxygenase